MTVGALDRPVSPIQRPTRQGVVETLRIVVGPADEGELPTGMVGVAAGALLLLLPRVVAAPLLLQPGDFLVTLEAENGHLLLAPTAVAVDAAQRSFELGVRLGERAW